MQKFDHPAQPNSIAPSNARRQAIVGAIHCCVMVCVSISWPLAEAVAQDDQPDAATARSKESWLEGAAFTRQLQSSGSVFWKDGVLGSQLESFGVHHRICIWLDRRVDPNRTVNAQISNVPLEQLLQQIAASLDLSTCTVGSVVYIGPGDAAHQLDATVKALRSESSKVPAATRSSLLRVTAAEWEVLTTPREALQRLGAEQQVTWKDLSPVPHDLMPARNLPPIAISDQISLLLVGFNLSYRWNSQQQALELGPMRPVKQQTQTYAVHASKQATFDRVLKAHPNATVATVGNRKRVTGTPALHEQLQRAMRSSVSASPPGATTKFRLKVPRQPLGGVARQLAEQLGWTVEFDDNIDQTKPVEFTVNDGSLDDLLEAMGAAAEATVRLDGKTLRISPK